MTQAQLAAAAGVGENTVTMFEAGQSAPHQSTMDKILTALEQRGIEFTNGGKPGVVLNPEKAVIPTR